MCQEIRKQKLRAAQVYRRTNRRGVNNIHISVIFLTESENFYGWKTLHAGPEHPNIKCALNLRHGHRSKEYNRYDCTRCSFAAARGISIAMQESQ